MDLKNKSLISIKDLSRQQIEALFKKASEFETIKQPQLLADKIIATLFFEPSTRTRLSFESALKRLGAANIGFASGTVSSTTKGESLTDTIKMVDQYADLIIMRHPQAGSAHHAAEVAKVPVINGGDGPNEHPTQTLLDLYSIHKTQAKIDGLTIGLCGDLKYGRTVHSLVKALIQFKVKLLLIAPEALQLPTKLTDLLDEHGVEYQKDDRMVENLAELDILYMTRIQKERFTDSSEYELMRGIYQLKAKHLEGTKPNFKILHPLPRVDEISTDVDEHPAAYYFEQAGNGVFVRQALLAGILA